MIGENTRKQINNLYEFRLVDRVRLKGKKIAIEIFEPVDPELYNLAQQSKCNDLFAQGKQCYELQQWDEAINLFEQALGFVETDGPCKTFIERCENNKATSPAADWDGAFDMMTK